MDNEATRLINDEPAQQGGAAYAAESTQQQTAAEPVKVKKGNAVAAAAGGFVAGAAVSVGATAMAATPDENVEPIVEPQEEETTTEVSTPEPEQVILANDEGIRYAHVDADNFSDAFAQARQQVGPGGVFEYDGRLYGTYYADEWNNMTAQERADYQSRVNYSSSMTSNHESSLEVIPADAEMISAEPVDSEIRVLGVEAVEAEDGQIMNVALVECDGDSALLVDVDNNGSIDVLIHDDNSDGQIQESEIHDVSDAGLEIADLLQTQAVQDGDVFYASNDDMPDYINDADSIMSV